MNKSPITEYIKNNIKYISESITQTHTTFINCGVYFTTRFNCLPSRLFFDNIDENKFNKFLSENEWQLLQCSYTVKNKKDSKPSTELEQIFGHTHSEYEQSPNKSIWIKDRAMAYITDHTSGSCNVCICYVADDKNIKDYFVETISGFEKQEDIDSRFYLLLKNSYGELDLKKYTAKIPDDINLKLNYGEGFDTVSDAVVDKIANDSHGLYIFHGAPGTGKSTYIKWLASVIKKKFIYVPEFMVPSINDPTVMQLLLEHTNSVIILEDAEKLIAKRDSSSNSMASLILNLTDGVLADIMKLSVIITYNASSDGVDPALLRKGRLKYMHEFKNLNRKEVLKLIEHHGFTKKQIKELTDNGSIKDDMSLAEVYNMYDKNGLKVDSKKSSFGFASNE